MGCKKCAEGHGCGCGTKKADADDKFEAYAVMWEGKGDNNNGFIYGIEYGIGGGDMDVEWFKTAEKRDAELKSYTKEFGAEKPAVEEPDWIPDGDGRAIGQQDFAINLSPLHAESKFDELSDDIAEDYEDEGKSPEEAERIGDATAAKIGYARHGKREMMRRAKAGRRKKADMVGSPSPTFDEGITGQDGPSDSPTNATFEARHRYGPRYSDMESARKRIEASSKHWRY